MKKMSAIVLIGILLASTIPAPVFADEAGADYTDLDFAKILGMIPEHMEENTPVTRAALASTIMTIMVGAAADSAAKTADVLFDDVSQYDAGVHYVAKLGIMTGVNAREFAPDNYVKYTELMKTMVTFLGYEHRAKASGGYPGGYLTTADSLGLMNRAYPQNNPYITASMLASVLKLASNADTLDRVASTADDSVKYERRDNYLKRYLHIDKIAGIITGNYIADTEREKLGYHEVRVGNLLMRLTDRTVGLQDLFGYSVTVYAEKDGGEYDVLFYEKKKNSVTYVGKDAVNGFENGILYYDRSKITISAAAVCLYNGAVYESYGENIIAPFLDRRVDGGITCIDNNNDGKADCLIVDAYESLVVGKIAGETLYDKFRSDLSIDLSGYGGGEVDVRNILNQPMLLSAITEGDILSFSRDLGGKVNKIVVTTDTYSGVLLETEWTDGRMSGVKIDGFEAQCSNSLAPGDLKVNQEVTVYFNKDGLVCAVDFDALERYKRGYLVSSDYKSFKRYFTIFNASGEFENLEIGDSVTVNGAPGRLDREQVVGLAGKTADDQVVRQAVLYTARDNVLTRIYFADDSKGSRDGLYLYDGFDGVTPRGTPLRFRTTVNSFGGKLLINNDTSIFVVPKEADRHDREKYRCVGINYFPDRDSAILFKAFGTRAHSPIADMLIIEADISYQYDETVLVLRKISTVLSEDGDEMIKLSGIDGKAVETETYIEKSELTQVLGGNALPEPGDIIRIARDQKNIVRLFLPVFGAAEAKLAFPTNPNDASNYLATYRFSYGRVIYSDGLCLTVELDNNGIPVVESYPKANFKVLKFTRNKQLEVADADSILDDYSNAGEGSNIFIYTYIGNARTIVIFE